MRAVCRASPSGDPFLEKHGVVGGRVQTPVTFCFIVNWNGTSSDFPAVEAEFFAAIKGILRVIKRDVQ